MQIFKSGIKLLWQDWRSGELRILFFALVIAVTAICTLSFYTDRLSQGLNQQAATLLGADLIIKSAAPIPLEWKKLANKFDLQNTTIINYPTVISTSKNLQLVELYVVNKNYPLRGNIVLKNLNNKNNFFSTKANISENTLWVQPQLLNLLGIQLGDTVTVGVANFKVTQLLSKTPENNLINIAPIVLMNEADVSKTQTLVQGSRVEYELLVTGRENNVKNFKKEIQKQLLSSQKIIDIYSNQLALQSTLSKANNYLALINLICIILAGIAIGVSAYRYTEQHIKNYAFLRCQGLTQKKLIWLILVQLITLGILGSTVGSVLGFFSQILIVKIFSFWINFKLPLPSLLPFVTGFLIGFLLLIGFALPRFLILTQISPLQVLRKEKASYTLSDIVIYSVAFFSLGIILFWQIAEAKLVTIILIGIVCISILLDFSSKLLFKLTGIFKNTAGINWKYGLANLVRRQKTSSIQLISFGLIVCLFLLITLLRTQLLNTWKAQIPPDAPNYFALNIQSTEISEFTKFFNNKNIAYSPFFPIVRGRLIELNNQPIQKVLSPQALNNNALKRELNLTWSNFIPFSNKIIQGKWFDKNKLTNEISIEAKLANDLGIKINDILTFQIADQMVSGKVSSVRTVDWNSFQPNFYIIFPSGILNNFPHTYMVSFYLPDKKQALLVSLVKLFPSVTLIDTVQLINEIQQIVDHSSMAISYIMIFALFASLAVLFSTIQATLPERLYETGLLRILGASRFQIRSILIAEFVVLGFLAGLLGAVSAIAILYFLSQKVFGVMFVINYFWCILAIILSIIIVTAIGLFSTRKVITQQPLEIIRKEE